MNMTRRFFIAGAMSYGAFGGCRCFRASHDFKAGEKPAMKFGVVSDIHMALSLDGKTLNKNHNTETFEHALRWFDQQGVDAVMICGDMADRGLANELLAVGEAWNKVFPNNKGADGRTVEKVFTTGNHDWEGFRYGTLANKIYPNESELEKQKIRNDYAKWWDAAFHEEFKPVTLKQVKGYDFIMGHWTADRCRGREEIGIAGVKDFFAKYKGTGAKPFFYAQHPHPKNTCYGAWAWGHDNGAATEALGKFPNAVAFSGHSHYTLTDERSIWQGAFTSIGASSLRYTGTPYDEMPPRGYENTGSWNEALSADKMTSSIQSYNCRQGMLVSVYDDCIVYSRREFLTDLSLGADWVQPLESAEGRPFAFAGRAKKSVAPQFAADANLTVKTSRDKTRGFKGKGVDVPKEEKECVNVKIPAANAEKGGRTYRYEVVVNGTKLKRNILDKNFHRGLEDKRRDESTICIFAKDEVPANATFTVTPFNCFGKAGKPLTSSPL